MPTRRILIQGRVQGVFFRATARDVAEELGVNGWIRNTEEGDVEAVVSGGTQQLERFIAWCRQGPPRAVVSKVEIEERDDQQFSGFEVKRSYI
jgi:acylphosphatase